MPTNILGISCYYHDSAAALLSGDSIIAAVQEERFTRKKYDSEFPRHSVEYCLREAGITLSNVDYVVFYDKPLVKFERLLETYLSYAPKGLFSFLSAMPVWLKEKLFIKKSLRHELSEVSGLSEANLPELMFAQHHQSHAASAFFTSPFQESAVLCLDGVGEWATTSVWSGKGNRLIPKWELRFPHSLGLLYSAFTYYTGFKVNSGEYKLMGLAPYGDPVYVDRIYKYLVDLKDDGSFRLNMNYFTYASGLTMTNKKFDRLFNGPPRSPESALTQKDMDIARSIQVVTEEIILTIARHIKSKLDSNYLCLAGGVALNCVANSKLIHENLFKDIWIQPAAGDAGGALGAALSARYEYLDRPRLVDKIDRNNFTPYLGPAYTSERIRSYLDSVGATYQQFDDKTLLPMVADLIAQGNVVGWYQGRMEFGPRALGNRSILGDPRNAKMQFQMNLKIKYRESFRPFAPSVKIETASDWFDIKSLHGPGEYMLVTAQVSNSKCLHLNPKQEKLSGLEKLKVQRSQIPAVTHVDSSARVQLVAKETNPRYWTLLDVFEQKTGCPVLINTSFNVRGEPIVCTPEEAYRCFMCTQMDYLIMEDTIMIKSDQPETNIKDKWKNEFELD